MRTSVTVDGVTLTADQVKKAWEELNNPEPHPSLILAVMGQIELQLEGRSYPHVINRRSDREFKNKGIYLGPPGLFNWKIVHDASGNQVLIVAREP